MKAAWLAATEATTAGQELARNPQDMDAFERSGWVPFSDLAADIAGVGFKTEPTT